MIEHVALSRLDGAPPEPTSAEPLLEAFGPGAEGAPFSALAGSGAVLAWARRRGGRPNEPLHRIAHDASSGIRLFFDGRLENRGELASRLPEQPAGSDATDAGLLLAGFRLWGVDLFSRIDGPFALWVVDELDRTVHLARDVVGLRPLYFRQRGPKLAFSSRPAPLRALDGAAPALNERTVARFLAIDGPARGETFFEGIEEVPAGEWIRFSSNGRTGARFASLRPEILPGRPRLEAYSERFLELLDRAVASRLASQGRNAILLSGGLDSPSVAASAARRLAARSEPPLVSISWVFRELTGIDESRWIDPVNRRLGADPIPIVADELWPLSADPLGGWPTDSPMLPLYNPILDRAFATAAGAGCEVVLTGDGGDHLWAGGRDWLRDPLVSGRLGAAAAGVAAALRFEVRGRRTSHPLWNSIGRVVRPGRPLRRPPGPEWLTPEARDLLEASQSADAASPSSVVTALRLRALRQPLLALAHQTLYLRAAGFGLDLHRPFRDRRILELFLGVPADFLYQPGWTKRLLRRAMRGRLPSEVLERRVATSMGGLAERGLARRGRSTLERTLEGTDALWRHYVRQDWLKTTGERLYGEPGDGPERRVTWHSYCLERWTQKLHEGPVQTTRMVR